MLSKSYIVSFIGSSLAHGVLLFGAGNLQTPARVEVQSAPTAMELILSQGTGEIFLAQPKTEPTTSPTETSSVCHPEAKPKDLVFSDDTIKEDTIKKVQEDPTEKRVQTKTQEKPTTVPAQPIPGRDIGARQIGSSFETHGPCLEQNFPPKYPRWARRQGWEGSTLLKVFISKEGHAKKVSVEKSSGHTILDEAAIAAVAQWKFHPAKELGVSVASELLIPIVFQIKENKT